MSSAFPRLISQERGGKTPRTVHGGCLRWLSTCPRSPNGLRVTIEDFLRFLLRNIILLVAGALLGAGLGYGFSYTKPEIYEASALGYVSASGGTTEDGNPISQAGGNAQVQYQKAQTYLPLFGTRAVGERIVEATGVQMSADEAAGSLTATLDPNAPIITVTAKARNPQVAGEIANAAVEATAAEARMLETGGKEGAPVAVQLVNYQSALVPSAPVSPDRLKFAAAGAAIGLLLALAIAWLRNRNDSRLRSVDDVQEQLGVPVLGVLPEAKDLSRDKKGRMAEPKDFRSREALRKLRTNLRFVDVDNPPRSIVVTSSVPAEGKSTVAANLARVIARSGQRTVLIDADLRRPVISPGMSVDGAVGLSQVLSGAVRLDDAMQQLKGSNLWVLPSGQIPPNPSELLGSRRMHDLVAELSREMFVIIDAPPVLAVTDAQLLSRHTDGTILVGVSGRSRAEALRKAIDAITGVGANVYGMVLNRVRSTRLGRIAYGDTEYGYGHYATDKAYSEAYADTVAEPEMGEQTLGEQLSLNQPRNASVWRNPAEGAPSATPVRRRRARVLDDPQDGKA